MRFEELVKHLSPTLKRITYRLSKGHGYWSDEDLYQEALLHLWQEFGAGTLDDKTDSYILQGCYFCLKNYLRGIKDKVCTVSIDSIVDMNNEQNGEELLSSEKITGYHPIDFLHNKVLVDTLMNNGFTGREKEILRYYAQGLTTREIGNRLGISHVMVVKLTNGIKEKAHTYMDFV